jgi:MinD-like ATPase involved in chromosome partitioning or flagellar assembly
MPRIISVHSYRGGTGKSNTTANLAVLLADDGRRVGVVDTDIQSPGIHILFGLDEAEMRHSLNDYLWGACQIKESAHDVTSRLGGEIAGKVFLIPSSMKAGDIARVLREGYDVGILRDGFHELIEALKLDVLMIDTHPGLNEETLLSIAISASVTVEVARKLDVPRLVLIVNKIPAVFDIADVKTRVEQTYNCEVAAALPHSEEMMALASAGIFVRCYPDHPITAALKQVANRLMT